MRAIAWVALIGCGDNACPLPPDRGESGRITVAATPTATALLSVRVDGTGDDDIGHIVLDHGVGTVVVRGTPMTAVAYDHSTDFPDPGETLQQVLIADTNAIHLIWLYCRAGTLYRVFYEGTEVSGFVDARGTCIEDGGAPGSTALPPIDIALPALDAGFQITGNGVEYDGVNPGLVVDDGATRVLLPFARIDCSDCGDPGWQEMHALLWEPESQALGIALFYFLDKGTVLLPSPMYLPAWSDLRYVAKFAATWRTCDS